MHFSPPTRPCRLTNLVPYTLPALGIKYILLPSFYFWPSIATENHGYRILRSQEASQPFRDLNLALTFEQVEEIRGAYDVDSSDQLVKSRVDLLQHVSCDKSCIAFSKGPVSEKFMA
jgi:hypothetical protein